MSLLWRSIYLIFACSIVESFRPVSKYAGNHALFAKKVWSPPPPSSEPNKPIAQPTLDVEVEVPSGLAFSVELPKRGAGISWGSDLSFRWVYVLDLEPTGEAYESGLIQKVHNRKSFLSIISNLTHSILTSLKTQGDYIIGFGNTSTIAKDFDFDLTVSPPS